MSKKIITCVLTLAMIFSVFNPALGYATTDAEPTVTANETVAEEPVIDETTPEEPVVVPAVTGLKAKALSSSSIKLTWNAVEGATGYDVYRYNSTDKVYKLYKGNVTGTSFTNTKLKARTTYYYKVKAKIGDNTGDLSGKAYAKTLPSVKKVTYPKAKTQSCSSIKVSWKKVTGATGYEVYRYSAAKKKYVKVKTTTAISFTNKSLKANTLYSYKVRAYVTQDGKKYYGQFSKVVKARTEKTDEQKIVDTSRSKLGAPYRYGYAGPKYFDCSGFVYWVYNNSDVDTKTEVERGSCAGMYNSLKKYKVGSTIDSMYKAKPGDIIFFKYGGRISHVGIYVGNGDMIHAANPREDVIKEDVRKFHKTGSKVCGIVRVLK